MAEIDISKQKGLATEIESLISVVKEEIFNIANVLLEAEKTKLEKEISKSKEELTNLENKNGISQVGIISGNISKPQKFDKNQEQKSKNSKPSAPNQEAVDQQENGPLFERLDLRMGRILQVNEHPQAENLYVETIDVGDQEPRTIVSGIRKHISKERLQNRAVVVLCNLKPANLRGVKSFGMLLCASDGHSVEPLWAPTAATPGQRLRVQGQGQPHSAPAPVKQLNSKEKVFETVVKDLRVNKDKMLVYKDAAVMCADVGNITTESMCDCGVA